MKVFKKTAHNIGFYASWAGQTIFNFSSYNQLYILNQQRLWSEGILIPNLHKALLVSCHTIRSR